MALEIGSNAPNCSLKIKQPESLDTRELLDNLGKKHTVLLFFPFVFTSVCTDEICSVSGNLNAYQALDAHVYAISVDSPFAQEAWAKEHELHIDVLSDFNREAVKAYDVLCPDLLGFKDVSKRAAFVVSKEGKISYSWVSDDPKVLPDFNAIQNTLKTLS